MNIAEIASKFQLAGRLELCLLPAGTRLKPKLLCGQLASLPEDIIAIF